MQGTIVALSAADGDLLRDSEEILVLEAMKMQHAVSAPAAGLVSRILVAPGDTVSEGQPLAFLSPQEVAGEDDAEEEEIDLDAIRPDLAEVEARHALGHDEARPEAVARRRKTGQRTARENVADLVDEGSFIEYGPLIIAAQRSRRSLDDLIARTPADGLIGGIGQVNGALFDDGEARCVVMSYDYTVLAGTQGFKNHEKKDRMFELAEQWRLPLVLFAEGGGGRPGDTDWVTPAGLHVMAFHYFARLSGLVPLVGIVSGRCFAGNAALLGCCDVVIATENATLGMGGPAMIEGGGLGVFRPEEVGPMDVQRPNGVVDIAVADEAEAVAAAKRYLSYFQGRLADWQAPDQRRLRRAIPEDRLRIYDVRTVIETLADEGSVLELRRDFGLGMVTALIRLEGRAMGLIANNPTHLAGAIDSDGADKAARFLQLCDAHDLPVVTLIDTPGMMVGPEVEKTALVRHCCRLFVIGANLEVPMFSIILRKAYGLGAQAMAGGSFKTPFFTVAWPSGEFGGMGLEGAVKLGYRKELEAVEDPAERKALFEKMVAKAYEDGKALNTATYMEFDDVIDPAETRRWLLAGLASLPPKPVREGKRRPNVDTW
jgi:acetyl-CoA carboxylase carboxyltransferase component